MTLRQANRVARAAILLGSILLAGCGAGSIDSTGPFGSGGYLDRYCQPHLARNAIFTFGNGVAFTNRGPAAVIDKVTLTQSRHLRILDAYAVPITGMSLFGDWIGHAKPRELAAGVLWSRRQWANGALIPPTPKHDLVDIVLVIRLLGNAGTADGVDIYYHTPDGQYQLHEPHELMLTTVRKLQACPLITPAS